MPCRFFVVDRRGAVDGTRRLALFYAPLASQGLRFRGIARDGSAWYYGVGCRKKQRPTVISLGLGVLGCCLQTGGGCEDASEYPG